MDTTAARNRGKARKAGPRAKAPVGPRVDPLPPGGRPDRRMLFGRTVTLEPLEPLRHAGPLFQAMQADDPQGQLWTYMAYGPWIDYAAFYKWLRERAASEDPRFYAIVPRKTLQAAGMAAYLNIRPGDGVIEVGHIWFAPALQKTREASEAIFLMIRHAFEELGYRRLEWKCDALNDASRAAALRFGFAFEGIFRQHMIVKGRNRDTAWYAIVDADWPALRKAHLAWLADDNFDEQGRQRKPLKAFMGGK